MSTILLAVNQEATSHGRSTLECRQTTQARMVACNGPTALP